VLTIIKLIRAIVKVLNSEQAVHEIGLGFVLGMCLGVAPFKAVYALFVLLAFLIIRCNLAAVFLALLVFKPLALLALDRASNALGAWLLSTGGVSDAIGRLSHAPILAWLELNNTVSLGGIVLGWILAVPAYVLIVVLVGRYRRRVTEEKRAAMRRHLKKYWLFRIAYFIFVGPLQA